MRRPAPKAAPFPRPAVRLWALALAAPLLLAGCTSVEVAVETPQNSAPAATAPATTGPASSSDSPAPEPVAAPEVADAAQPAAVRTFTTPDGAYSFQHPADWTVAEDPSQDGEYVVRRGDGQAVAGLGVGRPAGPLASPVYPNTTYASVDVPGVADPLGRNVSAVVGLVPGQSIGGEAIAFGLADGGDPAANYGWIRAADASFLTFSGIRHIGNGSTMLSEEEVDREMAAYTASAEGRSVLAMLASLTMDPSVTGTVCQDGNYVYTELRGLDCDEATWIIGELRERASAKDAYTVATNEHLCETRGTDPTEFHDPMYVCGPRGTPDVRFNLDPIVVTWDHPLLDVQEDTDRESVEDVVPDVDDAAVDCVGVNYEFTEVDGLTCPEAKGMLQPFLEGKGTPADEDAQVVDDTACTRAPAERGGATVPSWTCSRTQGGSFVAYARM
ncbi:hypothetical protein GCM10011374_21040 [Kocuria dechangensis]|uniref:Uncharacterized protein n=1 Tax=Kocuria dechangensis TaxID=1176249 RepID=A0A917LUG1_9MICC|nr:hypothetical protein GCM10011374_21040 [Kocuria dechangensis]